MTQEGISQEFRLKKVKWIDQNRNKIDQRNREIDQNERNRPKWLLSNKNKRVCTTLNYIEHFLKLVFAVTVCVSISAFVSLVDISKGIMSSIIGLNICAISARIKNYK